MVFPFATTSSFLSFSACFPFTFRFLIFLRFNHIKHTYITNKTVYATKCYYIHITSQPARRKSFFPSHRMYLLLPLSCIVPYKGISHLSFYVYYLVTIFLFVLYNILTAFWLVVLLGSAIVV